jgi:NAD(P) transhydrogenase subunit beta
MSFLASLTSGETSDTFVQSSYMLAALLFILGIKRLSRVRTAQSGNKVASVAMLLAVSVTVWHLWGYVFDFKVLFGGLALGGLIGLLLAKRVPMTAMPELVALFNGLGGAASLLVAWAEIERVRAGFSEGVEASLASEAGWLFAVAAVLSVLIGSVTLSGSLIAYAKLAGKLWKSRVGPLGNKPVNVLLLLGAIFAAFMVGFAVTGDPASVQTWVYALVGLTVLLGMGLVIPIGGADMPVVISLLNSYSGLAASATGFVLGNELLIVAGSLVGASGLILTQIMCKAMNRSLANVLFGGIDAGADGGDTEYKGVKSTSGADVAMILESAQSVIIVPGYGMAVAQAQHKVQELAGVLEADDIEVRYAIHPVAGRMPGHMNVLLAEANVPYEQLFELDQINSEFKNTDVVIIIGANDVCNPVAYDEGSAIAGMPVLDVWDARTVVIVKRSLSAGYAGIKNPLFERDNALMFFADGKAAVEETISEYKDL